MVTDMLTTEARGWRDERKGVGQGEQAASGSWKDKEMVLPWSLGRNPAPMTP